MPEVPSSRVRAIVRWIVGPTMVLEIAGIVVQAARGTTSHFNNSTPLDAIIFALIGIGIATVTLTVGVFLWNVRRDTPAHREGYLWGIRLGIALFILGCLQRWGDGRQQRSHCGRARRRARVAVRQLVDAAWRPPHCAPHRPAQHVGLAVAGVSHQLA
ncbi:MAG: hypothetical protein FJW22_13045 [Acidimicrobiia bacterium]|nr:hypothetical protein [Acidimicrobiia bacterium]